jgi:hypothetical protein
VDELLAEINRIHELAAAQANYNKTLALLRALKAGTVALDRVRLTPDGWQVAALLAPAVEAVADVSEPKSEAEAEAAVSP